MTLYMGEQLGEISEIIPNRLYLTNLTGVKNIKQVLKLKIDIIVSILEFESFNVNNSEECDNITLIHYNGFDISKYFDPFYDLMKSNPNKRILVHCLAGISRSVTLICSYLIKNMVLTKSLDISLKYTVDNIVKVVKGKIQYVGPNNGFKRKLNILKDKLVKEKIRSEKINNFDIMLVDFYNFLFDYKLDIKEIY